MPTRHKPFGDDRNERGEARLRCPKDATLMERIGVGGITVDRCATCGSLWLDALELPRVLAEPGAVEELDIGPISRRSGNAALGGLLCPRDKSTLIEMVDKDQPHVKTNACTVCGGVLLDAGELDDLSHFSLRELIRRFFNL